ncbi:hypothetical protein DSO57_1028178 [Entomophthora muscae]|uniref:Uncharacterized protein n=1 Tax=Entomophthora muscae TaxID=34485 RepID=A0ACC2UMI8_9FUNG|nr:hypothetical protein DSO57_1028178 [Entomophthora muscae]
MISTAKKKVRSGTQSFVEAINYHSLKDTQTNQGGSEKYMTCICLCHKLHGLKISRIDFIFAGPTFYGKVDTPELKVHTFTDHKSMIVVLELVSAKHIEQTLIKTSCSRCIKHKKTCSVSK